MKAGRRPDGGVITVVQALRLHDRAVAGLGRGRLAEAERHARGALHALERLLGRAHPDVAGAWQTLGHVLHARGRLPEAEMACRRALTLLARFPPGDADLETFRLQTLALQGYVERDAGRYRRARLRLEHAVALGRSRLGARHPEVARLRVGLGAILKFQGLLGAAERCYRLARSVLEGLHGADHQELASLYHNLAGIAHARGRLAQAERWQRRALALAERIGAPARIAADGAQLAALLAARGCWAEAELRYRRALRLHRRIHGPRHYEVAINLNNLAALLAATGRIPRAERTYLQAVAAMRAAVGSRHPDLGLALYNLGALRHDDGRPASARALYRRALPILKAALGVRHPDTRACATRMATVDAELRGRPTRRCPRTPRTDRRRSRSRTAA